MWWKEEKMKVIKIESEYIKLDSLIKYIGIVGSGSDAKILILQQKVTVNGQIEIRRGRKIRPGDVVEIKDFGVFKIL